MAGVARRNDELAHTKSLADIGDGMGHIPSMSRSRVTGATEHSSDKRAYKPPYRPVAAYRLFGSDYTEDCFYHAPAHNRGGGIKR